MVESEKWDSQWKHNYKTHSNSGLHTYWTKEAFLYVAYIYYMTCNDPVVQYKIYRWQSFAEWIFLTIIPFAQLFEP
jgi:hypothetical protein